MADAAEPDVPNIQLPDDVKIKFKRLGTVESNDKAYGIYPFLHISLLSESEQNALIDKIVENAQNFILQCIEKELISSTPEEGKLPIIGDTTNPTITLLNFNPIKNCSIWNAHPHFALNLPNTEDSTEEFGYYDGRTDAKLTSVGINSIKDTNKTYEQKSASDIFKEWYSDDYFKSPIALRAVDQKAKSILGNNMLEKNYDLSSGEERFIGGLYWIQEGNTIICTDSTLGPTLGNETRVTPPQLFPPLAVMNPNAKAQISDDHEYLVNGVRPLLFSEDIIIYDDENNPKYLLKLFSNFVHSAPWVNPVTNQFQGWVYQLKEGDLEVVNSDDLYPNVTRKRKRNEDEDDLMNIEGGTRRRKKNRRKATKKQRKGKRKRTKKNRRKKKTRRVRR